MKTLTQDGISDGQKKQLTRMIGDIADSELVQEALGALSRKGAERLKGNGGFVPSLQQFVVEKIAELAVVSEFADEEVTSSYSYLSGYKPKSLHDQTNLFRKLFPGLKVASPSLLMQASENKIPLPANAEGWFAIPNWKKNPNLFGSTYSEAVQKIFDALKEVRDGAFYNHHDGSIDENHLRQSAKSEEFWKKLAETQGNPDMLIVAAQFGIRHRGRSVRRARVIIDDTEGEWGLGVFAAGSMLLTHPERLQNLNDLWLDLPGDELSPWATGRFSWSPIFRFSGANRLEFDANVVSDTGEGYGSGSVFAPQ